MNTKTKRTKKARLTKQQRLAEQELQEELDALNKGVPPMPAGMEGMLAALQGIPPEQQKQETKKEQANEENNRNDR